MVAYKLYTSEEWGLVEPVRYLMGYGGVTYEHVTPTHPDWAAFKKAMPWEMPVLEVEGRFVWHPVAISWHLAQHFNLVAPNEWTETELYAIVNTFYDFFQHMWRWRYETNAAKKAEMHQHLKDKIIPFYLRNFEDFLAKRGGYFGGKQWTWADFFFVGTLETVEGLWGQKLMTGYPSLQRLFTNIQALPDVQAWLAKRQMHKW